MAMSVSSSTGSSVSTWADSIFSKLDTKKQGYIEKSDLATALTAAGGDKQDGAANVDDAFSALDNDSDGKVTKSELTTAMTKLSDQLNAQYDASRMAGAQAGGPPPDGSSPDGSSPNSQGQDAAAGTTASAQGAQGAQGPRGGGGPHGPHGGGGGGSASTTSSTSATTTYDPAADTNNDGTVSAEEEAAYKKTEASAGTAASSVAGTDDTGGSTDGTSSTNGARSHKRDPMHELAHALNLLKAYTDNSAHNSAESSEGATAGNDSISVTA